MEFFARLVRLVVTAIIGIVVMFVFSGMAESFGGAYTTEHHLIPNTSTLAMGEIILINVLMSDILGEGIFASKTARLIKMGLFFVVWIGFVTECQEQEVWRIEAIQSELGDDIVAKAFVYGGYIAPSVAVLFSYRASLEDNGAIESLYMIHPLVLLISVIVALAIVVLGNYVQFVYENFADILWIFPNACVIIYMLMRWALPYQSIYEE